MLRKTREESSIAQRGECTAKQHTVKRTRKHSKGGSKRKGCQEDIQNPERSMVRYRNRESRYA